MKTDAPISTQTDSEQIQNLLLEKRLAELRSLLSPISPEELAPILESFSPSDRTLLFRCLSREQAADVFALMDENQQLALLEAFSDQETRDVLANMSPDDRTYLFEELPAQVTQRLLNLLPADQRKEALQLLGYPEGSVGRLMSPDFAVVKPNLTIQEAMREIKKQAPESETLNMIYVTDENGKLLDAIRLRKFISAPDDALVESLMDRRFTALTALDPEEIAVKKMRQTGYFALPVTDSNGVLLGVVTADDVLDVAVEGATEDIHKSGAVLPLDMSYLNTPLAVLYRRRISWLVILVFVNIFSGAGIAHFEQLIESVVALVFFLPLLIDSGGNAGSQAATLVIRSMALGEIQIRDFLRAALRELRVSFLLGLTMSVAVFFVALFRSGLQIATVVSLAMICIVIIGSLAGMALPFIFRLLKMDPASASAPLVTSIADILGVIIYLSIASAMLGNLATQ